MTEMTPVRSSNVQSVGWDDGAQELVIEFKDGAVYGYPQAGRAAFEDMLTTSSPGAYVARWLKHQPHRKIS